MRKRKGGVFIPSVALALAAHAVLFILAARAIGRVPAPVYAPAVDLLEVQLAGKGDAGSGGSVTAQRPAPRRLPAPAKPAAAVSPSPSPAVTPGVSATTPTSEPKLPSSPVENPGDGQQGEPGGAIGSGAGGGSAEGAGSGGFGSGGPGSGGLDPIADINPVPLRDIAATYPASARRLGQQGLVRVEAVVDDTGVVTSELIAASSGFGALDNAALDAVKRTHFLPAMKNGKPVACRIIVPIRFQLKGD